MMDKKGLDIAMFVVGIFALTIWGFCAYVMAYHEIPEVNTAGFAEIRTKSGDMAILIVGYFFGSSVGSRRSGDTVRNIAEQNTPSQ